MKKSIFLTLGLIILIILAGCSPAQEDEVSEDLVATQVSIILTETALHQEAEPKPTATAPVVPTATEMLPEEEATLTPTETPTESPTEMPTSTPDLEDPAQILGSPAWSFDFSGNDSPWDNVDTPQAVFETRDGFLNLTARANANWHSWYLSSPTLKDAYVEATIDMTACSGADRFGLAVRGSSDGQQFYFMGITCDGRWGFFRMAEGVNINILIGYQEAESLAPGLTEPHRVGIWMDGDTFTMYINGLEVGTTTDTILSDAGYTGFLVAFANTPGFTVRVDELNYWNLP